LTPDSTFAALVEERIAILEARRSRPSPSSG
jgi:hypothetical protein